MTVDVLQSVEAIASIAQQWNRLAWACPMRSYDWLEAWWRHYQPGGRPMVLAVRDGRGRLAGLAPWRVEVSPHRGRVIRWLGDGRACSDHLSLLVDRQEETAAVAERLVAFLLESASDWDLLRLDDCDAGDPCLSALVDQLACRGMKAAERNAGACWAIDLPADWESFLAMQSKSHRKQLRRADRNHLQAGHCRWRMVADTEQLAEVWPVLVDLHQRRRRSLGEPGCFACARFAAFHAEVSQRLLDRGQLRLSVLELHGRPAAAEYHFAGTDTVFAYQGGVDPERLEDGPGQLSMIAAVRRAIEERARVFDLLRGDEPYKPHWRATPRPTCDLRVASPRRSAAARAYAGRWLGDLKRGLGALGGRRPPAGASLPGGRR